MPSSLKSNYLHTTLYIYIYIYTHTHTYAYIHVHIYIYADIYILSSYSLSHLFIYFITGKPLRGHLFGSGARGETGANPSLP